MKKRSSFVSALAMVAVAGGATAADLRFAVIGETSSIDPHFQVGTYNGEVARHIFDFLIETDENLRLKPALAEAWRAIDDLTWEIRLRRGVRFHDGTPFGADDVLFTFKRAPEVPNSPSSFAQFIRGKAITKVDDYTLRIATEKPYPLVPEDLANFVIVSKKHGEGATTEDYNSGRAAVGTGSYRFAEWVRGERVTLVANPESWRGKPKWDRVTLKLVPLGPSRVAALLAGDVDIIGFVPTADIPTLQKNPALRLAQSVSDRLHFMTFDTSRDITPYVKAGDGTPLLPNPLRDQRVRKAISMAIDRKAMVERIMDGAAVAASQMVPPGFFGYNPNLKVEEYSPEAAKRLLAQAGYPDGFRLTISGPINRYVNDTKAVEAMGQYLTRLGLRVEVGTVPANVYLTRASQLQYSFFLMTYGNKTGEASSALKATLQTFSRAEGSGDSNRGRYSNAALDALLDEAMVTVDEAKREKLLWQAGEIAMRDVAALPLYFQVNVWAMRKGLAYHARADQYNLAESTSRSD